MKTCPECAEQVQDEAKVCRFCGHRFEGRRLKWWWPPAAVAMVVAIAAGILLLISATDGGEDVETVATKYLVAASQDDPSCTTMVTSEYLCLGGAPGDPIYAKSLTVTGADVGEGTAMVSFDEDEGQYQYGPTAIEVALTEEDGRWRVSGWN